MSKRMAYLTHSLKRCHRSLRAVAHVKYECDSTDRTHVHLSLSKMHTNISLISVQPKILSRNSPVVSFAVTGLLSAVLPSVGTFCFRKHLLMNSITISVHLVSTREIKSRIIKVNLLRASWQVPGNSPSVIGCSHSNWLLVATLEMNHMISTYFRLWLAWNKTINIEQALSTDVVHVSVSVLEKHLPQFKPLAPDNFACMTLAELPPCGLALSI